jgi:hypothetical protein
MAKMAQMDIVMKIALEKRSQTYNPKTERYVKRDTNTGRFFMDVLSKMETPFAKGA